MNLTSPTLFYIAVVFDVEVRATSWTKVSSTAATRSESRQRRRILWSDQEYVWCGAICVHPRPHHERSGVRLSANWAMAWSKPKAYFAGFDGKRMSFTHAGTRDSAFSHYGKLRKRNLDLQGWSDERLEIGEGSFRRKMKFRKWSSFNHDKARIFSFFSLFAQVATVMKICLSIKIKHVFARWPSAWAPS